MKNLLLLLAFFANYSFATTYYVSPTGNDSNPGTIGSPFKTIDKLNSVLVAGDIAYVRGGTYISTAGNSAGQHFSISGLTGTVSNLIKIWAYPGEKPLFDLSNISPSAGVYAYAMHMYNCNYVHIKGLTIKNLKQDVTGAAISFGFVLEQSNDCILDQLDIFNIGGTGYATNNSNRNHILNCDSHNNGDGMSNGIGGNPPRWDSGDGFNIGTGGDTSTDNVFDGCRSWMNGDDGWDGFEWSGTKVTYRNCWSFWNSVKPWGISGTQPSEATMTPTNSSLWSNANDPSHQYLTSTTSGEGFKLGGCNIGGNCPAATPTVTKKFVENCIAFGNVGTGYAANMDAAASHRMSLLNCISYNNGNDGFGFGTGRSIGIAMIFKNNWSWNNNKIESGADWVYDGLSTNVSNNYWGTTYNGINYGNLNGTVNISSADFVAISDVGVTGPRQADGSLPTLNFLRLAASSDLIDKGINVGLSFNGLAPDLGVYEYSSGAVNIAPIVNAGVDKTIKLPVNSITVTGIASDADGTISSYLWTKLSGPGTFSIVNSTSASTTINSLVQGTYQFEFKATDNTGASTRDTMQAVVQAANILPTVSAGIDQTITLPISSVSVTGTTSDADGTIVSIAWSKVSGPVAGVITILSSLTTTITGLTAGIYKFQIKVTDNDGGIKTDTMQVTVNAAINQLPVANAGPDKSITLPTNSITITGSGTDVDGTISTYVWSKVSGPGSSITGSAASLALTGLTQGTYLLRLQVTDNSGGTAADTMQLIVNAEPVANLAPTVSIIANQTVVWKRGYTALTTNIFGQASDADGTVASYTWTKTSGPSTYTLNTPNEASTDVTFTGTGTYVFRLRVTDNLGAYTDASVQIIVRSRNYILKLSDLLIL